MFSTLKFITSAIIIYSFVAGIYEYSIPRIEGGNQQLSAYQNKKMMVILLPVEPTAWADSLLYSVDTMAYARRQDLAVVAVPSIEAGFNISNLDSLHQWYRSKLGAHVVISAGLYTRRFSPQQHGLFQWLTNAEKNGKLQVDASAPGLRYFIHPGGQLYAVLHPGTPLWGETMQRVLNTDPSTEN